ncbi:MAG TPA: hypothetical protein VHG08_06925 [Longimicrobium sp.]|nr:hypothetical protein [Longimicrobium sp.]
MHRLDQELDEFEAGIDALESSDEFEWLGEADQEWTGETDGEAVFDEVEEMELAAELLGLQSEEEMEEFLGKLIKKAGGAIKKFASSGVGKALGGVLKTVAKKALPIAGAALGNMVLPGVGGMIGSKLASAGGKLFGLELEGMSPQDQEFEIARRFVRLSGEAARQAARMPMRGSPMNTAKDAVLAAAQMHAPGLSGGPSGEMGYRRRGGCTCGGRGRSRGYGSGGSGGYRAGGAGYGAYRQTRGYGTGGYGGYTGNGSGYGAGAGSGYGSAGGWGGSGYGSSWLGEEEAGGGGGAAARGRGGLGRGGTWVRRGNTVILRPGA